MYFRNDIDAETVRSMLYYNRRTGVFKWRYRISQACKRGDVAGTTMNRYRWIALKGHRYAAHRLAWLYVTGAWPDCEIDHINMDRSDNRFVNLREATHTQNNANRRQVLPHQLKGVTHAGPRYLTKPWVAQIALGKKHLGLGYYATPEEAHEAYKKAARKLFKEFARDQ